MLLIKIKIFHFIKSKMIWFSPKPKTLNCLTSYYKQSLYSEAVFGYRRRFFFTKIININSDEVSIEAGFDKKTSYEIRRAIKDGIKTSTETNLDHFISFYNFFAKTKQLPALSKNFKNYRSNLVITKALYQEQNLVMHAYLIDRNLKRSRLLYSASHFRNEHDTQIRAIAGRANRLLHFKDMCYFKCLGFTDYDLGGYALNTLDESLLRINQFKDGFGGELKKEFDYVPLLIVFFSFILNKFNQKA